MCYAPKTKQMATPVKSEKRAMLAEKKVHFVHFIDTHVHSRHIIQRGNEILFLRLLSVIADQIQFNLHNFTMRILVAPQYI